MTTETLERLPEVQWAKVSGPDALQPLDRNWIRYLRVGLLAAAVLIAWQVQAWQDAGYSRAAEQADLVPIASATPGAAVIVDASEAGGPPAPTPPVPVVVISPTPTPTPTPAVTPTPTPTPAPLIHRVRPGDTLSEIAQFYSVSLESLQSINGIANPNDLFAGQELRLPPDAVVPKGPSTPSSYLVQNGDTLSAIAVQFGVSLQDLLDENDLSNPDNIFVGQELTIPSGTT